MEALSPNTRCDNNEARALKSLVDTFGSMLSNGWVKSETPSEPSEKNALSKSSFFANGNSDDTSRLKRGSFSGATVGKEYVWRAKAGNDGNLVGEAINGKPESPSVDDNAFNNNSCCVNRGDESKASRTKMNPSYTVGASWGYGKEPKDYVWRVRGQQDSDPKTDVSRIMQTNPSPDLAKESNSTVINETSSQSCCENVNSRHPDGNNNYTQSRLRVNHSSTGTLSGGLGKGYMWRPRKGKDLNLSSSADMVHASDNGGLDSQTSSSNGLYLGNGIDDSQASKLKRDLVSTRASFGGVGKDFVWRVRTKGTSTETKPLTEEANESLRSTCSHGPALLGRDAKSSSNKEFEDFLLDTLGHGFQLERSTAKEVLGNCGYDMKKSLETILDLVAVNLDKRIDLEKEINCSSSETLSSHNQCGRRTMRSNVVSSRQSNETDNQQKEVSTVCFHVPVGPNSTLSTSVSESTRGSSGVVGTMMIVPPQEDDDDDEFDISKLLRSFVCESLKDEAEEESYQTLRKTVKEFRDTTKEYYKAAAEAFASGDHAQASILLEKGQFFYNKAREADEESAQKIHEFRGRDGGIQDDMCLDLQNHNSKEAIRLLKCHLRSLSGILSIKNLKIMFGVGEQDVEKRKRAVIKLLEKESIEWTEDEDSGTISIRLDQINPKSLSFTENSKAL